MTERLIIDDTTVYEIDEECLKQRKRAEDTQNNKASDGYNAMTKNKLTKK